ncbi:MAG: ester cyclase [Myxococcales bacterium]|nr:ester cyclase [Myxococcales bacterium]MCB9647217.1 ester cyclase [Deltaproteobacteria bacterium]
MMSDEMTPNERLGRAYLAIFNDHDLDACDRLLTEDFVSHLRVGEVRGVEAFKALMTGFFEAFPDAHWTVDEWIFTEDRVVIRYHWEGTQQAAWLGIPPTHQRVRAEGLELLHVRDGRIFEVWNYSDLMGMAALLGAPEPLAISG